MKYYFFIPLLVIMMGLAAANTSSADDSTRAVINEHLVEQQNGMVISDKEKTTKMMIPSPGATKAQVKEIVQKENKKLLDQFTAFTKKVMAQVASFFTKTEKEEKSVKETVREQGELMRDQDVFNTRATIAVVILMGILLGLFVFFRTKKEKPAPNPKVNKEVLDPIKEAKEPVVSRDDSKILEAIEGVRQEVLAIPAKVKKVDQIVITDLEIGKRRVTFTPKIEDNYHLSLRIPIGQVGQVSDPSKITRTPTNDRGRLVDTTIAAFRLIDANANDVRTALTRALVRLAIKDGEIRVEEII